MKIGPLTNYNSVQQSEQQKNQSPEIDTREKRVTDQVEISDNARSQLSELADEKLQLENSAKEERMALIRKRIESGFYEKPEVKEKIAERLMGDLDL